MDVEMPWFHILLYLALISIVIRGVYDLASSFRRKPGKAIRVPMLTINLIPKDEHVMMDVVEGLTEVLKQHIDTDDLNGHEDTHVYEAAEPHEL